MTRSPKSLNSDHFSPDYFHGPPALGPVDHTLFRSKVGELAFLAHCARPDLLSVISILAGAQASTTVKHMESAGRVLQNLSHHRHRVLDIPIYPLRGQAAPGVQLSAHFDANYASQKARSGAVFYVNHATCYWFSRKQKCICLSTTEAELVACSMACKELLGALDFLSFAFGEPTPHKLRFKCTLYGDNVAANLIGSSQANVRKVRHLSLADLFCREVTNNGTISICYIKTDEKTADCLTKVLPDIALSKLLPHMSIRERADLELIKITETAASVWEAIETGSLAIPA